MTAVGGAVVKSMCAVKCMQFDHSLLNQSFLLLRKCCSSLTSSMFDLESYFRVKNFSFNGLLGIATIPYDGYNFTHSKT